VHRVDSAEFAARLRQTEVYTEPASDVDGFASQLERSVTNVLHKLAPWHMVASAREAPI